MEGQSEFAFWHALVRDVCFAQIPRGARADKHVSAARWIETVIGERVDDQAEILAHHYSEAIGYGDASDAVRDAACKNLLAAAERSAHIDITRMRELAKRALELSPPGSSTRSEAYRRHAVARAQEGDVAGALMDAHEARDAAASVGSVSDEARALGTMGSVSAASGDHALEGQLLQEAVSMLEPQPPGRDLGLILRSLAGWMMVNGRYREAIELGERARHVLERHGKPGDQAGPLDVIALSRLELGDLGGLHAMREAVDTARESCPGDVAIFMMNLSHCLWLVEGPGPALRQAREGVAFAKSLGQHLFSLYTEDSATDYESEIGDLRQLASTVTALSQSSSETGANDVAALSDVLAAKLKVLTSDQEAALQLLDKGFDPAVATGEYQSVIRALEAAAVVRHWVGDSPGAVDALWQAVPWLNEQTPADRTERLPALVRTAVALGEEDLAAQLVEGLDQMSLPRPRACVRTALATLAESENDFKHANDLYTEAVLAWSVMGNNLEHGYGLLGSGRCLLAMGHADAVATLAEARAIFARMGATALVADADEVLARATALSS
jgi:hypothetical protein